MVNNKALVEILLPAAGKSFDVYIPLDCKMSTVNKLVAATLAKLSEDKFISNADSVLCDAETGIIYNANKYITELNIKNGTRLILI